MKIFNPANSALIKEIQEDTAETVRQKVSALRQGQKPWNTTPISERIDCIRRFGSLVKSETETLAKILTSETGKPIQQSINEISGAHNRITHIVQEAETNLADEVLLDDGAMRELVRYESLGVIGNISAWNFPYNVGYNVFLYALVSGNAVLYKPSEYATLTGLEFKRLLHQAGVPKDVFDVAVGDGTVGQMILDAQLDGYFFTGSFTTGQKIATTLAPQMVPVQLELGGKDPLYVANDVPDVAVAAANAAEGAFYNNGQSCCAVERIYVHEDIYEDFINAFVEEVKNYPMGDPTDLHTFVGPLTRPDQVRVLEDQISDALSKGGQLLTGGQRAEKIGAAYFEPTVITNTSHEMALMLEENFGPLVGIQKVRSDEEAVDLMQDTTYGLTAAVFSSDEQRAWRILDQMNTGTVYWNCCDRVSPNVPWSGRKQSGLGSTLGRQGIRAFVQPKSYQMRQS